MAATYNALLRDYSIFKGKLMGRVLLSDLKQVPPSWKIQFRGQPLDRTANLAELLCSSQEPLQIFQPIPDKSVIYVKTLHGTVLPVYFSSSRNTAETMATKMPLSEGTLEDQHRYYWERANYSFIRTLSDYNIQNEGKLHLILKLRGGGSRLSTVDMEGSQVSGRASGSGGHNRHPWEGYSIGLNLLGVCPNKACISNFKNKPGHRIYLQAGYGVVRMTPKNGKFPCPACQSSPADSSFSSGSVWRHSTPAMEPENGGMIAAQNFLVSFARTLFRFKKTGYDQPVKTILMESLGGSDQYKMFDEKEGTAEYDFIEITTVGRDSSPFVCVNCDLPCRTRNGEVVLSCGHAYHRQCARDWDCVACQTKEYRSMGAFLGTEEEEMETASGKGAEEGNGAAFTHTFTETQYRCEMEVEQSRGAGGEPLKKRARRQSL